MRKRKGARSESEASKTVADFASQEQEGKGFFACYLLVSLNPRYKGHTYIGFTVNPRRRIRQHNGEIGCGAWRTKRKRPWEMVLCIYGFPTNVSALQFEWAWQHPVESLAVRKAAAGFKSLSGIANKIKLAYTMLTLPSWQSMNITVNFFSTKYTKHSAGCPSLPEHMNIEIGSMDELPCYTERVNGLSENEDDSIDEVGFDATTSNGDSVPDICDDSVTHDSPQHKNHGDKISEAFRWNKELQAEEPGHSFAPQDQSQPFGSVISLMAKSSTVTSSKGVEIIEDTDFMSVMNKGGADLSQLGCEQSVANKNQELSSTCIVPHEAEIIDLSTPPSCGRFLDRKRKVFIDLTNDSFG